MRKPSKGIALPIETIVIIAIVVLVLVVIIAFFVSGSGTQISRISAQEALARGCADFAVRYSCDVNELPNVNIVGFEGGLEKACRLNGYSTNDKCAELACRCAPPP